MGKLERKNILLMAVAVLLLGILPALNMLSMDSPLHLPDFYLNLFGKYLSLAVFALGLGLLWGFTGILSLGQAVFFGLGAYCMGMHLTLQIGAEQSKYGEAVPDFMVWNQVTELPLFWKPFSSFGLTLMAVALVPVLFAIIFGFLTFRSRIRGVYVAILTQALAYAAWLLFNRNEMYLGGTNGLTDFKTILGFPLQDISTQRGLYLITAICLIGSYLLCQWITTSKLGKVLRAIRDNENRLQFSGYSTTGFKVFAFALAAFLSGLAGALYVTQVGIITPNQIGVLPSLEVVVWVAVGGRDHLIGGPLGAIVINALRTVLTTYYPELWPFILGGLFMAVVLLFPSGLAGLPSEFRRRLGPLFPKTQESLQTSTLVADPLTTTSSLSAQKAGGISLETVPSTVSGISRFQEPLSFSQESLLYLEGVTVSFEGFLALQNLNFYMGKGELRFVIGPNGAGKTTLLDVICGRVQPLKGRVLFEDAEIPSLREHRIANRGIGRKFQTPSVFPFHTVFENLSLSLKTEKGVFPTLLAHFRKGERERIFQVLEMVDLAGEMNRPAGSLSHGQKQWLEIGMLIAQDPKLLLLDEPVAGMTGREREKTGELLLTLTRDHTVLVIEHDMEFVRHFGRTVTVLHEGSVLCEGPMEQVQNDPRVIDVYLGREREVHA